MKKHDFEFKSALIKEFNPFKDQQVDVETIIRYHYTSPEAFLSIINNQTIRFTDIKYLNDKSEGVFLVKLIVEFFEKNHINFSRSYEAFNSLISDVSTVDIKELKVSNIPYKTPYLYMNQRHFVFCMSNKQDSLNMWNYYVNNDRYQGYNIGFKISKLLKTFDVQDEKNLPPFVVYYGNVLYKEKDQLLEIHPFFDRVETYLKKHQDEDSFNYAIIKIMNFIQTKAAFFKSPSFEAENEYRVVIAIADERVHNNKETYSGFYNKKMKDSFCVKNGLIVPCMEVKFDINSISKITISPITEFEINRQSIRELLRIKGNEDIGIIQSKIPIRF